MAHDLTDRTKFVIGSTPLLGLEDVFGVGSFTHEDLVGAWAVLRGLDGVFHAVPVREHPRKGHDGQTREFAFGDSFVGTIYGPIAEGTTVEDVEGATYAHDDGTAWHFAHCSPAEHVEFAARAQTFAEGQFADAINAANVKAHEASNAPAKALAVAKLRALGTFAKAVGAAAHRAVVAETLGHYHRTEGDHLRPLAVGGIDSVLAAWEETGKTNKALRGDLGRVRTTASIVRSALVASASIEWRHGRAARLAREAEAKKAKAEAAQQPADTAAGD